MIQLECRSELAIRARRGLLADAEAAALEAHLAVCDVCRVGAELGRDFEAIGEAEAGDAALVTRIAAVARRGASPGAVRRPFPRFSRRFGLLAAALMLLAAGAGAATLAFVNHPSEPAVRASKPTSLPGVRAVGVAGTKPAVAPPESSPQTVPPAPLETAVKASQHARAAASADDASALFREANAARRAGDSRRALRLYADLERSYPRSREATLAHVSHGGLLLDTGAPARALSEFDRYLALGARSGLGAEALYGKGRALAALGRPAEETANWQGLLARYPGSPYAAHARRRLSELGTPAR